MTQGESSRDKIYGNIFTFLLQINKPATSKEIRTHCDCAKATFYKYLNELCAEDKLICNPKRGMGKHEYRLSTKWSNEWRRKVGLQSRNTLIAWDELRPLIEYTQPCKNCNEMNSAKASYCSKCGVELVLTQEEATVLVERNRLFDALEELLKDPKARKLLFGKFNKGSQRCWNCNEMNIAEALYCCKCGSLLDESEGKKQKDFRERQDGLYDRLKRISREKENRSEV